MNKITLDTAFAHDVTTPMLVFQFKIILIRPFCLEHQHGRQLVPGECQRSTGCIKKRRPLEIKHIVKI
jgi:hypothetical protein